MLYATGGSPRPEALLRGASADTGKHQLRSDNVSDTLAPYTGGMIVVADVPPKIANL